jgi:uncharacterized membrane protein
MTSLRKLLRRLRQNEDGASAIMFATSLTMLMGAAAMSVDVASIYLAKRELQGMADAAALAAANHPTPADAQTAVNGVLGAYEAQDVLVLSLEPGVYRQDGDIEFGDRFTPTLSSPTGVKVQLERSLPLFFANIFGHSNTTVVAQATAQRTDMAAYSLSSGLASLSGGIPNQLLSALAGTELGLSVMDTQALANAELDLLGYADALMLQTGTEGGTYGELFAQDIALNDAVAAMSAASKDSAVITILASIAGEVSGDSVRLGDIIDLGPLGRVDYNNGDTGIAIDAYSMLRALLEISLGKHYDITLDLSASGLAKTTARLVGGSGWERSPWLTVTSAKDYTLRTAQSRLLLEVEANTGSLALAKLKLPVYVELAEGEARLTDIVCDGDPATHGVKVAVTPSVGTVAVAAIDASQMGDLTSEMTLSRAALFSSALINVSGSAEVELGGMAAKTLHFSMDDIRARRVKSATTDDLARAIAASLIDDVDIRVSALGLGLNASAITGLVGSTLQTIAPAIDGLLVEITTAAGIKLGNADVRVDKARCGVPMLVA